MIKNDKKRKNHKRQKIIKNDRKWSFRVKEGSVPWTGGSIGTEKSSILHALDCMSKLQHPTKPTCAMAVGSWQLRPTGDFPPPTHY